MSSFLLDTGSAAPVRQLLATPGFDGDHVVKLEARNTEPSPVVHVSTDVVVAVAVNTGINPMAANWFGSGSETGQVLANIAFTSYIKRPHGPGRIQSNQP